MKSERTINKPCPFCGSQPGLMASTTKIAYKAVCKNKNCPVESFWQPLPEMALAWWNRRAGNGY